MAADGVNDIAEEASVSHFATELSQAAEDALPTLGGGSDGQLRRPPASGSEEAQKLQSILKIPVTMKVVVGSVTLPVSELRTLVTGDILTLDRKVGDPVDVLVNGQILARGVLVIADEKTSQLASSLPSWQAYSGRGEYLKPIDHECAGGAFSPSGASQ